MADIELVIKIPENIYKYVQQMGSVNMLDTQQVANAIFDGTPLPKGHGRIADIDKVLEEMKATRTYDIPFALERVKPIIEADKAESEKA
jgi:hypothetical protein